MGDVKTHATINHFVRTQIEANVPAEVFPAEHFTHLELGNYLTDVSQFRDPPAHHHARGEIFRKTMAKGLVPIFPGLFLLLFGVSGWVRDIFGERGGPKHGQLAEFLRRMILAVTHEGFSTEGIAAHAAAAAADHGLPAPPPPMQPLTPGEVDRVYEKFFTQYWPHEHLDFPPTRDLERHREHRIFARTSRGTIRYLEWDIQYLSEELSRLESDWVWSLNAGEPAERRADFAVCLGKLLHAVEDYWFHSNFSELLHWGRATGSARHLDPATPAGALALLDRALEDGGVTSPTVQQKRKLYRRLRYPVYEGKELSEDTSAAGTDMIFTGGFGKTDVFHTLGMALEGMESGSKAAVTAELARSELILMQLLFSRAKRTDMVKQDLKSEHAALHKEQLMSGKVHAHITRLRNEGKLAPRAADEMTRAFDLDKTSEDEYWLFPGVGGLLIMIMAEMEEERIASELAQRSLDRQSSSVTAAASVNGASAENVGTHSLLAKDTPTSRPFREEAVSLAKHASASIATTLLQRVATNRNISQGLDWDSLLRFYLAYPSPSGAAWWNELTARLRGGTTTQPSVGDLQAQPTFGILGPERQPEKLQQRRNGTTRRDLERYYDGFQK